MNSKLDTLLQKMKHLEDELLVEVHAKEQQFRYEVRKRKVHFAAEVTGRHKLLVKKLRDYLSDAKLRNILSAPVIWFGIVPAAFLDFWATVYQCICFPVYGIPKVRRRDFVVMDRRKLAYLNSIERFNCVYCEYFNGLMAYVQEIAGRTEQYWCPIKHAMRLRAMHSQLPALFGLRRRGGVSPAHRAGPPRLRGFEGQVSAPAPR